MNRIFKNTTRICLLILITLIILITQSNAGLESARYDNELASAAVAATKGQNEKYFTFNAEKLIGDTVYFADWYGRSSVSGYNRVGEYCIDERAGTSGVTTVKNIIDITSEGEVISYKSNGKNIVTTDQEVVNIFKSLSYAAINSINNNEGAINVYRTADSWKQVIQRIYGNTYRILNAKVGLSSAFLIGNYNPGGTSANTRKAQEESKDKSYTGRFIFLYANGGQSQIIFGAKEGPALGNLKIKKVVEQNQDVSLEGIGFILQNKKSGEYVFENNKGEVDYTDNKDKATVFYTDDKGETKLIKDLKAGKYVAYETTLGDNYGYELISDGVVVKVDAGKDNERIITNKQIYVKLSGYVWEDITNSKDGDSLNRNDLFRDDGQDTTDELMDGIKVSLIDGVTGEVVKTTETSSLGRYPGDFEDHGHGEYLFEDVLVDKLEDYYIEFEYDGIRYTNVVKHPEKNNGSKAIEGKNRDEFNAGFSKIEGTRSQDGTYDGYSVNASGDREHTLQYNFNPTEFTASLINTGEFVIKANTDLADFNIFKDSGFEYGDEEIKYINLGLYEREHPDLAISKDLQNVKLSINGYNHIYKYNMRYVNQGEYTDGFNVGVKYGKMVPFGSDLEPYTRAIYKSDYDYEDPDENDDKNKELQVSVTYKITLRNESSSLKAKVNSIVDYFDSSYTLVPEGTGIGIDENTQEIKTKLEAPEVSDYNADYKKAVINTDILLDASKEDYVYVQFELSRQKVAEILGTDDTPATGEVLENVVEINSYSTFDEQGSIYAGIDGYAQYGNQRGDSAPGSAIPGDKGTYEDDTDSAPGLKLEVANPRQIRGKVFVDDVVPDAGQNPGGVMTGKERKGSGAYEDGEKGLGGVKVTLTETTGTGKVYEAETVKEAGKYGFNPKEDGTWTSELITDPNKKYKLTAELTEGDFFIPNYIPGDYTLTYTWGDETYTVQNYKATVVNKDVWDAKNAEENKGKWYKEDFKKEYEYNNGKEIRNSDALDNYETREKIDREMETIVNSTTYTIHKMDSTTPLMGIGVEYAATTTSYGDELKYEVENVDFGIVERAKQDLRLRKRLTHLKATLANGQVLTDVEIDENGNVTGNRNYLSYVKPDATGNGFARLEIDNELIQGTVLEVGYEIKATNASELDYRSSNYYNFGIVDVPVITITPSAIIDYLDADWAFENEKNPDWLVKTREELENGIEGIKVAEEVYNKDLSETDIENRIILYTKSLAHPLEPTQDAAVALNVSKILTTTEDISLGNETELIKVDKSGGRTLQFIPGNYPPGTWTPITEKDTGMAETTMVSLPTGENRNYIIMTTIGISALAILALGVFVIKKKVVNNNNDKKEDKKTSDD